MREILIIIMALELFIADDEDFADDVSRHYRANAIDRQYAQRMMDNLLENTDRVNSKEQRLLLLNSSRSNPIAEFAGARKGLVSHPREGFSPLEKGYNTYRK